MALTNAATGLTVQQWDDSYFMDYVRESRFFKYMGTDINKIIQIREELTNKKGKTITFALVNELTGDGVTGNGTLEGNEEGLDSRSHAVNVAPLRHAVAVTDWDEQMSAIDLRNAAKEQLKIWSKKKMRDGIIAALASINGVAYGSATEVQKDAWLADNADRVMFGALLSNNSSNDHSASLANIDNTNDKLSPAIVSAMKELAQNASPKIRPINISGDQEWFVMFAGSRAFRDLKNNSTMQQANRDARERGKDNPLFTGDDLIWDSVIIREIPEIQNLPGVGAGGIDVCPVYLCGAQAVGVAWAMRTKSTDQTRDYGFVHGAGIAEIRGIEKLIFGTGAADTSDTRDHGVVTGFMAGVATA
jgi:N4-gp56 family major capsid protein